MKSIITPQIYLDRHRGLAAQLPSKVNTLIYTMYDIRKGIDKSNGKSVFRGIYFRDKDIYIFFGDMGISSIKHYLNILLYREVKRLLLIGSCGSLLPDIEKKTQSIIVASHSDIGKIETDKSIDNQIKRWTKQNNYNIINGKVWSVESIFEEYIEQYKQKLNDKYVGVDMELAWAHKLCMDYNTKLNTAFIVSDIVVPNKWKVITRTIEIKNILTSLVNFILKNDIATNR